MNNIRVFDNEEFGQVRTVEVDGQTYFVAVDVTKALGYRDSSGAVKAHCRWAIKQRVPHPQSSEKLIEVTVIPEGDMYRLIMRSQLPNALKFESWVCDEVLPQIREIGEYSFRERDSYEIEDPAERARRWAEEYEEKRLLEADNVHLRAENSELKPKAYVYDKIMDSRLLVNFRDAAKEIGISQSQFTGWLKDCGYIYSTSSGELRPMEPYMQSGMFQMKAYQNPYNGYTGSRTYITPQGLATFKLLLDNGGHNRNTM